MWWTEYIEICSQHCHTWLFDSIDKLTSEIKSKAISHIDTGYQKGLTYKRKDGSYSAFGERDRSGSTWLTAFVAKSFNQASKYIKIDKSLRIFEYESSEWFSEVGKMFDKSMQGGSSNGISQTAYTLLALIEN